MTVQRGKLWIAMSLEFGLAAQDYTEREAKQKLIAQITDYVEEANADAEYRDYWLNRKASWGFYVLYYWLEFKSLWKKDNSVFQFTDAHA
jgi:hypothetical protein